MKTLNTKQLILSVALDRFSEEGYSGTSIREIARIVGIRESAIYNHYKSKEEIFTTLLSEFRKKSLGAIILNDDLLDDLSNPEKFLLSFASRLMIYWNSEEERKFIRLLLIEQHTKIGSAELSVTMYLSELRTMCKMIFGEMIKSGIIKNFDTAILSEEFIGTLFFIRTEKMSGLTEGKIENILETVSKHVKFFWSTVKAV